MRIKSSVGFYLQRMNERDLTTVLVDDRPLRKQQRRCPLIYDFSHSSRPNANRNQEFREDGRLFVIVWSRVRSSSFWSLSLKLISNRGPMDTGRRRQPRKRREEAVALGEPEMPRY
jgi:hypothetical protein